MDVNVRSWCLRTALHDASEYGCIDVAKVLLQNGADANIQMDFSAILHFVLQLLEEILISRNFASEWCGCEPFE